MLHAAIDACIQARETHDIDPAAVSKLIVRVHPIVTQITAIAAPATGLESKFSVFHAGAVAFLDGTAGEAQFSDARAAAPDVIALRSKVEAVPEPEFRRDQAHVRIIMADGREHEVMVEHARGTLRNPLSDAALEEKFRSQAEGRLTADATQASVDLCWGIEALDDVSRLARAAAGRERA